jgi:hypothetical protein
VEGLKDVKSDFIGPTKKYVREFSEILLAKGEV